MALHGAGQVIPVQSKSGPVRLVADGLDTRGTLVGAFHA
ncbi:hypothetical protein GMORB2_3902 [Geosmithia morbida]|uniref:Uncharacterized protein n=1 Tax=Geosmithia morbida TaxID=1094350 RepID=A0A9P4YXT9_9HYPO|nr:uncharacterized protein GMORB2_3902 [Geosmithia morbida]KAF4125063.1 hypothetical protein GMORB2_3902 [Geosmithia morbida]